jgi:hypothetical protein
MGYKALHWARGDALVTASGSGILVDFFGLTDGETVRLSIDHADQAVFSLAEPPRFVQVDGAWFALDLGGTDGHSFAVYVTRVDADEYPGYDYGSGGAAGDLVYSWTREGVIE